MTTTTLIPASRPDINTSVSFGITYRSESNEPHITSVGGCLAEQDHGDGWHIYAHGRGSRPVPVATLPKEIAREHYAITEDAERLGVKAAFFDYEEEAATTADSCSHVYVLISARAGDVTDGEGHHWQWHKITVFDPADD